MGNAQKYFPRVLYDMYMTHKNLRSIQFARTLFYAEIFAQKFARQKGELQWLHALYTCSVATSVYVVTYSVTVTTASP